jgi:hypothetical protein
MSPIGVSPGDSHKFAAESLGEDGLRTSVNLPFRSLDAAADLLRERPERIDDPHKFHLLVNGGERDRDSCKRYSRQVSDPCACEVAGQHTGRGMSLENLHKPVWEKVPLTADPMDSLLKSHIRAGFSPYGRTSGLTPFANQHVARLKAIPITFAGLEAHLLQIIKVKTPPADIDVAKVWPQFTLVLRLIEHLAQDTVRDSR